MKDAKILEESLNYSPKRGKYIDHIKTHAQQIVDRNQSFESVYDANEIIAAMKALSEYTSSEKG